MKRIAVAAAVLFTMSAAAQNLADRLDRDKGVPVAVQDGRILVEPRTENDARHGGITWTMTNRSYRFAADGIVIKTPNAPFVCREHPEGRAKFRCRKSRGHVRGTYAYGINVIGPDGQRIELDPLIISL